ncbi:hypothetical protein [Thermococcus sp.]
MIRIKAEPMLKPKEIRFFSSEWPEHNERPKVRLLHEVKRYRLA